MLDFNLESVHMNVKNRELNKTICFDKNMVILGYLALLEIV